MPRAYDGVPAPVFRGNAVRRDVLYLRVLFFVFEFAPAGGGNHRPRHRVGKVLFKAGGDFQRLPFAGSVVGNDALKAGRGAGEGACPQRSAGIPPVLKLGTGKP